MIDRAINRAALLLAAMLVVAALIAACSPGAGDGALHGTTPPTPQATASVVTTGPASAPAAGSGASTPSAEPTEPSVTIGWVGDTTPGSRYGLAPRGGRALYSNLRAELRAADIMTGNLEGTFGVGGKSKGDGPSMFSFQAPPTYAKALRWAGFDLMNVANNHAHDYLEAGMLSTYGALADVGIAYTGTPGRITIVEKAGVRVAFIGAAPYRWSQSIGDIKGTAKLVRRARKQADIVIVLMHAGAEGSGQTHTPKGAEYAYGEFRGSPRAFAHAMIDAGASAVLGSGPHVVRGVERYKGRLIAYSLGNFAGWHNFGTSGTLALSGLLTIRVDRNGDVLGGRWLPLRLDGSGVPAADPKRASLKLVRTLSKADFPDPWPIAADGTLGSGAE